MDGAVQFHGVVTDEDGVPVSGALVETWHAAGDHRATEGGLPRCDEPTSTHRNNAITDRQGRYNVRFVPPRALEYGAAPFIAVSISVRGGPSRLITRAYLPGCHLAKDVLLGRLPAERRQALIAVRDDAGFRFDITLSPVNGVVAGTSGSKWAP
ncbi:intradiol ring-cleavage dioxygenase [Mycolicibacterium aromaticivorans]|uniref:dioxygenase family protein n=1 Tax=Mycolicibacterium aromaticivorans TaxID=318425 RepID=UPI00044DD78B|nr:intradiol ring-cleavage dioxygenase [Mycolicibacterium aromaticivorans]